MLLIIDEKDAEYCIKRAADFGIKAKIAGKVTEGKDPQVSIHSKLTPGKSIIFR